MNPRSGASLRRAVTSSMPGCRRRPSTEGGHLPHRRGQPISAPRSRGTAPRSWSSWALRICAGSKTLKTATNVDELVAGAFHLRGVGDLECLEARPHRLLDAALASYTGTGGSTPDEMADTNVSVLTRDSNRARQAVSATGSRRLRPSSRRRRAPGISRAPPTGSPCRKAPPCSTRTAVRRSVAGSGLEDIQPLTRVTAGAWSMVEKQLIAGSADISRV